MASPKLQCPSGHKFPDVRVVKHLRPLDSDHDLYYVGCAKCHVRGPFRKTRRGAAMAWERKYRQYHNKN